MAYHNHNPLSVSDSHDDLPLHHFTHQSNTFPSSPPHPNSKPNSDPLQTTAPSWLNNVGPTVGSSRQPGRIRGGIE
ncbi:hypothetical protein S245_021659 [Arachis hypogaea]